jgi:antiviral defense system Shedu protein SduA
MPGAEIVPYLQFAPASEFAAIDAIVFLEPTAEVGFAELADGRLISIPTLLPSEAHYFNAEISARIRSLPETCAMRDGRKWKRIPHIVLTTSGHRHPAYEFLDVDFVIDVTGPTLFQGFSSPVTWNKIEEIVNRYHQRAMTDYEQVGFIVTVDRGLLRVKRAFRKKNSNESEFYFGVKDRRRFRGYVTIGRDLDGADFEGCLFEQLLNDPKTREQDVHRFFEEHPNFLAQAMMGVPISHQPYFPRNKQTPDFSITPILPRHPAGVVKLLELKGPEANVLASPRHLHRGLASAVIQALAQVSDYGESLRDPMNLKSVENSLGYAPEYSQRAVLIGRTPPPTDSSLWEKRKDEQPAVRIITYDEILQEHRTRLGWRRKGWFPPTFLGDKTWS